VKLDAQPAESQLALGAARDGAEWKLNVAVESESQPPYQVGLDLRWNPAVDVRIVHDATGEEVTQGPQTPVRLDTNNRTLLFRVFPKRQDDSAQSAQVTVEARGTFAKAEPTKAQTTYRLPRPNRVELSVVSLRVAERATERWGNDQGGRLLLHANRSDSYQLFVRNLASEDRQLHARLYRVPSRSPGGRLFNPRSPSTLLKQFDDLGTKVRSTTTGTAADLRDMLIAQTGEKGLRLPANQLQPVAIPLEPVAPPPMPGAPGAAPAKADISNGLVLVLSSADGKELQPFVKWIELATYLPDDLLEIRRPELRNGRLSFVVGLKDERLANELGLAQRPLVIQWERQALPPGIADGQLRAELSSDNREPELWAQLPAGTRWPLVVQLHIDDYPRALVSELEPDLSGGLKLNNWKRDRAPAVQIGKLGLFKTIYEIQPHENWLPFPAAAAIPEGVTVVRRQRTDVGPIYAKIDVQQEIPVTVDLQADLGTKDFAEGAFLRLAAGSQEVQGLGFDRRVEVWLTGVEGGAIKLDNRVSDWLNLPVPIRIPAAEDRRVEIVAEISEGTALTEASRQRLTVVFDRNPPQVRPARAEPSVVNPSTKPQIMLSCEAADGEGSGIDRVEFVVGFDQNGNQRLEEMERQPAAPAALAGRLYQAEIGLVDSKKEGTYLVEAIAVDRAGHRAAAPMLGSFEARIPPQGSKTNRSTFGGSKEKDEPRPAKAN
jgi:hypothetical protein